MTLAIQDPVNQRTAQTTGITPAEVGDIQLAEDANFEFDISVVARSSGGVEARWVGHGKAKRVGSGAGVLLGVTWVATIKDVAAALWGVGMTIDENNYLTTVMTGGLATTVDWWVTGTGKYLNHVEE